MSNIAQINILNFDRKELKKYFEETLHEKPFHADQVIQWVHQYGQTEFSGMTNLSKSLRQYLTQSTIVHPPTIIDEQLSRDGTRKWLFKLDDGAQIETVLIPDGRRGTLCISSQVGCPLKCPFCATGQLGFQRNLETCEIIGQLFVITQILAQNTSYDAPKITNIVFMGMGEPLLNFDNVVRAIYLMLDNFAYNLSQYRVTVSTAGITPMIDLLAQKSHVSLAVSLHAPNDELRNQLVPINRQYPLKDLMAACRRFFQHYPRRKVSFEYILIHDVNDQPKHAQQLIKLVRDIPSKINLIPYNPTPGSPYQAPSHEEIKTFQTILINAHIRTILRKTRGSDIQAACGQLAGKKQIIAHKV